MTNEEIVRWMNKCEKGKSSTKEVTDRINMETKEDKDGILFETRDAMSDAKWIHKNYLKK